MGKYDSLRDIDRTLNQSIEGVKYQRQYSEFQQMPDLSVLSINGLLQCQECFHTLNKEYVKGSWKCSACRTTYDTETLVKILLGGNSNGVGV